MILLQNSSNHVIPHNVVGGVNPLLIATEEALRGLDITQKLPSGDATSFYRPARGDEFLCLLQNGQNVAAQTPLMSAGDGTLIASTATFSSVLYQILAASANITNLPGPTTFSNGTYTFAANTLQAGDVYHIHGKAVVSAQNSTNTHQVKVLIGSTLLADCGASALAAGNFASFDIFMTIRSVGTGGKLVADVVTTVNPAGTPTETPATVAATTIDTTVTEAVTVTATVSATSAGNVIALQEFEIDLQRAGGSSTILYSAEAINNSAGAGSNPVSGFNTAAFIRCYVP
jgi:hypothetical protein